jgi:hypothetical protein
MTDIPDNVLDEVKAALEPFKQFAPKARAFVESRARAANNVPTTMAPTKDFRLAHFEAAAEALAKLNEAVKDTN